VSVCLLHNEFDPVSVCLFVLSVDREVAPHSCVFIAFLCLIDESVRPPLLLIDFHSSAVTLAVSILPRSEGGDLTAVDLVYCAEFSPRPLCADLVCNFGANETVNGFGIYWLCEC